ncbi:hypothetical protein [Streptomyces poriferorum]|uniref:RanBP2-type domain-containing protein n=1 Tax=Streptomyces poriferorum TaxID=2798799 RepID=A0ABY9IYN6_9ACTN|nr:MULTISPECIES: hypothetical protein [unclassified Streptomyces]MDP5310426.1 hypothetical protein [Streptomyces sp. Alt4]WLQ60420.1 hypothetical protein P8A19_35575 [Streptomyces sp. Alt2]
MDAAVRACWFCAAENDGSTRRCGFCGHRPEDGPAPRPESFTPAAAEGFTEQHGLLVADMTDCQELIAIGPDLTERRALAAFSAHLRHVDQFLHDELRAELSDPHGRRISIGPTLFVRTKPVAEDESEWRATRTSTGPAAAWLA